MINHQDYKNRLQSTYINLLKEYEIFCKQNTLENKYNVKKKINEHREVLNRLMTCINNLFLK